MAIGLIPKCVQLAGFVARALAFAKSATDLAASGPRARRIGDGLADTTEEITALSHGQLTTLAERHAALMAEVASVSERELAHSRKLLNHLGELVQAYDPVHVLRRGFSITLNGQGRAVKSAADLSAGETITTRLAAGQVSSTVTKTS